MSRRSTTTDALLSREMRLFTRYLLGVDPPSTVVERYVDAARRHSVDADSRKLVAFAVEHPWSIAYLDAGLVFVNSASALRQKLHLAFAILETVPEYADRFLPVRRTPWYLLVLFLVGARAVARAILGVGLVLAVR